MAGKFKWQKFSAVDLNDVFFDTLKSDYPEFIDWFRRKQSEDKNALIYNDEKGIGAFLYLKRETEEIKLTDTTLPCAERLKIDTLRLAERIRKQRLGEGALGVALWYWKETKFDEIYVTIFEKHTELINLFNRFGFICAGKNSRGECVYVKSRKHLDYANPYKSFPFINSKFTKSGIIPINDIYHDRLFPYSELAGNKQEIIEATAGNGITKVYIGSPFTTLHYFVGEPILIYRRFTGEKQKGFKSVITSYATITKVDIVKDKGKIILNSDEYLKMIGNKSVFKKDELLSIYKEKRTLVVLEMVYNGYFGKGHNVNYISLKNKKLFEEHPYNIEYSKEQYIKILEMGDVDVQNIIVD